MIVGVAHGELHRLYERLGWRQIGTAMHDTGHGTKVPALLFRQGGTADLTRVR